ncbi:dipeptide epimerase [Undibacterium sp.]|uniref:dipeptide epimerase n=1 Tax=Undibacterium sp. TaxID=1914977 RepID=UPI002CB97893|nr:dipeptide epimerase [Undibacterium sp.]HTD05589.1 dipeptide epimerase [Undibacterium sp.]
MNIHGWIENIVLKQPFFITGRSFCEAQVLRVRVSERGHEGIGEAAGVYYKGETAALMLAQLEAFNASREPRLDRFSLHRSLPAGGLRNALDCALWQLESSQRQVPLCQLANLRSTRPLVTTMTVGVDTPENMAINAAAYAGAKAVKLKLDGGPLDRERIRQVRRASPQVRLLLDANQGWTLDHLENLLPTLLACRIELIEQPLPLGADQDLLGYSCPIPLAADESFQQFKDLENVAGKYQYVNIKLDKCGGLTEALQIAAMAPRHGLGVMVGSMLGTSLAMAPAFIAGQYATIVDLDAPLFLTRDVDHAAVYQQGSIDFPSMSTLPVLSAGAARATA